MSALKRISVSTLVLIAACVPVYSAPAARGDDAQRLSKNGRTAGVIDGVEVELEYGRPNVKAREIWGDLVPYGEVWRTGADEATTISFSADVLLKGESLKAGTYGLFTIPTASEWTVIFNKVSEQWGAFRYDADQDALRVTVEPRENEHVETMDFVIAGNEIVLRWERLAVPIAVRAVQ